MMMLTKQEYIDLQQKARATCLTKPEEWRVGQFYINYLYEFIPEIIQENITGKEGIDPFYVDENLDNFWAYIWNNHVQH